MSGRLRTVRPEEMVRVLKKIGFRRLRKSPGGHLRFGHSDGRKTTIPMHKGVTLGRGLLRKILNDIALSPEELSELL